MNNQELKIVYDSEGRAILDKEVLDLLLKEHEELAAKQAEVSNLRQRLHWIWAIGVDYDGYKGSAKDLEELIDEMVEFTQMSDDQVDYSIYRKGAIETANKITHYLYRMSQNDTSKEVAIGRCLDWIKNNFGA